ncbi:sporulation protein YjcZ [Brevibacillus choshinensis]|nr:sporulation protein YjcZ [Brevibacillus choshinensis]
MNAHYTRPCKNSKGFFEDYFALTLVLFILFVIVACSCK